MTPTQARNDCGHCSNGPKSVADQSNARILAPISPPPANTASLNCDLMRSMWESIESASARSNVLSRILLLSLVRVNTGETANERRPAVERQHGNDLPVCGSGRSVTAGAAEDQRRQNGRPRG